MVSKLKRRTLFPILMVVGGLFLMGSSVFVFMNSPQPTFDDPASSDVASSNMDIPHPEIRRISLADSKAAYDQGNAVFIDVRGEPYYSQGHVPGALSLTEEQVAASLNELDPKVWIITYCT
jgi:hypothetical protein